MSPNQRCWGIYREAEHSPSREDDDAAILRATAKALTERGFEVRLCAPEQAGEALSEGGARIFAMCEQPEILDALGRAEDAGAVVVNSTESVRNTYRRRLIESFERAGVRAPQSRMVATDPATPPPALPVWIKRQDFHATRSGDVLFADCEASWRRALASFAERGMPFVVVQDHVAGDLIKFYGVRPPGGTEAPWFVWFYHRDQQLAGHAFDKAALRERASAAAAALNIEVFGGDAIIDADGQAWIIDINAWPSFALYREAAAAAIADHLAARFARPPSTIMETNVESLS
jgi:hypothetical protein